MSREERERLGVRRVLEALSDAAPPPRSFDDLVTRGSDRSTRVSLRPVLVVAGLAAALGGAMLGVTLLGGQHAVETVTSEPLPSTVATAEDVAADEFPFSTFETDGRVLYPLTFLDGTRIALWLPANLGSLEPTTFRASAQLRSTNGDLAPIQVDATYCTGCSGGLVAQFGPWQLTASGGDAIESIWPEYVRRIEPTLTTDGFLVLGGSVVAGPIDGPDVALGTDNGDIEVTVRSCLQETFSGLRTDTDLQVINEQGSTERIACAGDQSLQLRLPGQVTDSELNEVAVEYLVISPSTADRATILERQPVSTDDTIVTAGGFRGFVRGYDASTGQPLWEYRTNQISETAFVLGTAGSSVVVASQFGPVVALDDRTGTVSWTRTLDQGEAPGAAAVSDDETVVYLPTSFTTESATEPPRIRALDAATGAEMWRQALQAGSDLEWAPPTLTDELILVADTPSHRGSAPSSYVHAIDRPTGAVVWRFDLESDQQGFHDLAILADDRNAYAINVEGVIFAIELATGTERWRGQGPIDLSSKLKLQQGILEAGDSCYDTTNGQPTPCP